MIGNDAFFRVTRKLFRFTNKILNKRGLLLSKPEVIHGSPALSGATQWSRRLVNMRQLFNLIEKVEGDIWESGVHWGYGILMEWILSGSRRKIYGFDSFLGHSTPHANDRAGGKYRPLDDSFKVSENDVWKTLELGTGRTRAELSQTIELIGGWIQETGPAFKSRGLREGIRLAFVHADCDIYEPFRATLFNCWDLLEPGGIILVGLMDNPELYGKTQAVKEFLATLPPGEYVLETLPMAGGMQTQTRQSCIRKTI
ncbi:MAG: TylF/MycF/NovP-related O-methyltransferase [Holophaga sp.]